MSCTPVVNALHTQGLPGTISCNFTHLSLFLKIKLKNPSAQAAQASQATDSQATSLAWVVSMLSPSSLWPKPSDEAPPRQLYPH